MPQIHKAVDVVNKDTLTVSEYIGAVASSTSQLSVNVATVTAPSEEKFYVPEYDEYVVVISGEVHLNYSATEPTVVRVGESCVLLAGEKVKWSWIGPCQYVHVRMPAVSPDYHKRESNAVAEVLPGGAHIIATASTDNVVKIWDTETCELKRTLTGHGNQVMSVSFLKQGHILTSSTDRTAKMWDSSGGDCLLTLSGHMGPVYTAAASQDGSLIVTSSHDRTARVWSAVTGACLATLAGHERQVHMAQFSCSGSLVATASDDCTGRLWEVQGGACFKVLRGHNSPVYSAVFSPDDLIVVTASADCTARLWNVQTGNCTHTLKGHNSWVRYASFSTSGRKIVTASGDNTAKIWLCSSGECLLTLEGHTDWARVASFSEDGQQVVTSSKDGTARIWCATSGCCLRTLEHGGWVRWAAFATEAARARLCAAPGAPCKMAAESRDLGGPAAAVPARASLPGGARYL